MGVATIITTQEKDFCSLRNRVLYTCFQNVANTSIIQHASISWSLICTYSLMPVICSAGHQYPDSQCYLSPGTRMETLTCSSMLLSTQQPYNFSLLEPFRLRVFSNETPTKAEKPFWK